MPALDEPCRTERFRSPPRPPLRCIGAARTQHEERNEGDRDDRDTDGPKEHRARDPSSEEDEADSHPGRSPGERKQAGCDQHGAGEKEDSSEAPVIVARGPNAAS